MLGRLSLGDFEKALEQHSRRWAFFCGQFISNKTYSSATSFFASLLQAQHKNISPTTTTYHPNLETQTPLCTKEKNQHFTRLGSVHKLELRFTAIFRHNLKTLERRIPFPTSPWYKPPAVYISSSAEIAIANHNFLTADKNCLANYTDGRGIDGRAGSSVVAMFSPWPGAQLSGARDKRSWLGSVQQFIVYFG